MTVRPRHLELDRTRGLTVDWMDGRQSFYPVALLRRMSPSAEMKQLRENMARNPLTVLPSSSTDSGPLIAEKADFVGNYAIRIQFSDGHSTGIFSWEYLREIDPDASDEQAGAS